MKVDFDEYASDYESLLKGQLGFFNAERDYFSEYKVRVVRERTASHAARILDFGTGIGLTLPFVRKWFPSAEIHASDISEASLDRVRARHTDVTIVRDRDLVPDQYDIILVITVIHHVAPDLRPELFRRLETLLRPGGELWIFEHNPYNPITQRMVSTCPFDEDAVLISARRLARLIEHASGLEVIDQGYTLFFPQAMSALRPVERHLRWLPLGGQYHVTARR